MKTILFLILVLATPAVAQKFTAKEIALWKKQASQVTIIRDTWGIAHVYGKTDADAVFGFLYAQCEDDFERIELNYLNATARLAEAEGESKLYHDLRQRLFYDTLEAITLYNQSPDWLKKLCTGFAAGVNYYLYTHPEVKPKLLTRFQPWMPLLFSEGSIGGDIESSISVAQLKSFYGDGKATSSTRSNEVKAYQESGGSNGFAIAPARSATGNALLMINPHTSFYFRPEIHVNSDEGLSAYGAVTWGQFFIYQGFNQHCGWMHTSSQADAIDLYYEKITKKGEELFYTHGAEERKLTTKKIKLAYSEGATKKHKEFTVFYTHHGPIIDGNGETWVSIRLMKEPLKALMQSYLRTKASNLNEFEKTMELRTNSSNNTVYADNKGNIAYWHGNYIPRRNPAFNWNEILDGTNPATEWGELHTVDETIHLINPASGWLQNCNSTPFTLAGESSPSQKNYPTYMAPEDENARGVHAVRVFKDASKLTIDQLIARAYDPQLPAFEMLIPSLVRAYENYSVNNPAIKAALNEPIALLNAWDYTYSASSVATTLAIYWATELRQKNIPKGIPLGGMQHIQFLNNGTDDLAKIKALESALELLQANFGSWKTPWGEVNRFQRLTGGINEVFDDNQPSTAVPFASAFWGSLASFNARTFNGTKKMYGYSGNSFVAAVEFGKEVKAKSVLAGGVNRNPNSPYFKNQADLYCKGEFKDVLFYRKDVEKNATRIYRPGE